LTGRVIAAWPSFALTGSYELDELWEFDDNGLMRRRVASINDIAIEEQAGASSAAALSPTASLCRCTSWPGKSRCRG